MFELSHRDVILENQDLINNEDFIRNLECFKVNYFEKLGTVLNNWQVS